MRGYVISKKRAANDTRKTDMPVRISLDFSLDSGKEGFDIILSALDTSINVCPAFAGILATKLFNAAGNINQFCF